MEVREVGPEEFREELRSKEPEDRIAAMHFIFRNIPREHIEEYMSVTEEQAEELFKEWQGRQQAGG